MIRLRVMRSLSTMEISQNFSGISGIFRRSLFIESGKIHFQLLNGLGVIGPLRTPLDSTYLKISDYEYLDHPTQSMVHSHI